MNDPNTNEMNSALAKWSGSVLVRDKNGRPVIDDGLGQPESMLSLLTDSEKEELKHDHFAFRRIT